VAAVEEPDTEIAPGIGSKKVKSKAADISAAMNLGAQDVDAVAEAVKGMSADQQQAVRSIVG
jgi:deoxyribose-phosphate aldolase